MSGRLKLAITVAALLAALAVTLLDQRAAARRAQNPPSAERPSQTSDRDRYNGREFFVTEVIDGDTLHIDARDGRSPYTKVRLIGVDTPETKRPGSPVMYFGPEAFEYSKALAQGRRVKIWLDAAGPTRDRYGRLLAYVYLPDGRILNEVLIADGYGYADTRFRHGTYEKYRQIEAAARRAGRGLWAAVTTDQMPRWRQKQKTAARGTTEQPK
jgi:micrococcal nuclease